MGGVGEPGSTELALDPDSLRVHRFVKAAEDLATGTVSTGVPASIAVGALAFGPLVWRTLFP